jgi:hypothetical protein
MVLDGVSNKGVKSNKEIKQNNARMKGGNGK